jgi:uncharacterized protein (DUF1697 family)
MSVTDRHVALLRGVNVGTANRIAMSDLRRLFERLGYGDVRTLLNSGNVVFTVSEKAAPVDVAKIEAALLKQHGVKSRVVVLKGKDLIAAVRVNPLARLADHPSRLLVMAFPSAKDLAKVRPLLKERWIPEVLALGSRAAYLWCAEGIVDSPIWAAVNHATEGAGTARNFATMQKLAKMVEDDGA